MQITIVVKDKPGGVDINITPRNLLSKKQDDLTAAEKYAILGVKAMQMQSAFLSNKIAKEKEKSVRPGFFSQLFGRKNGQTKQV